MLNSEHGVFIRTIRETSLYLHLNILGNCALLILITNKNYDRIPDISIFMLNTAMAGIVLFTYCRTRIQLSLHIYHSNIGNCCICTII